jgi:2'-5' RNA ligase
MSDVRYGFYLRPSPEMCRAQAEIHHLLERQYGLRAAGQFMPHATIKGFFRSSMPVEHLAELFNGVMQSCNPLPVWNHGVVSLRPKAIVLNIALDVEGARNEPLKRLHDNVFEVLRPAIDPGCHFTAAELTGDLFLPHLTLAMADIDLAFFDEIAQFVKALEPIGPDSFTADTFHLYRFWSEAWNDRWWESLHWQLLHSWRL